ncbi:hypothetical protein ACLH0B_22090 [Aeromonas salmonicida]|uniref:hypothetical protein n=1 Tax=Aeromonas salmonicida TaxID=645 RepID=UPI003CFCB3C4
MNHSQPQVYEKWLIHCSFYLVMPKYRIGNCQSGSWKKPQKIEQPVIRDDGLFGPDADFQSCESDEIVVGGGGECMDPARHFIHDSRPYMNGWSINCFGVPGSSDLPAKAYAICLRKQ